MRLLVAFKLFIYLSVCICRLFDETLVQLELHRVETILLFRKLLSGSTQESKNRQLLPAVAFP
jgi:hypothetical protein